MKSINAFILSSSILFLSSLGFSQESSNPEVGQFESYNLGTNFFIPNSRNQTSGKHLIENDTISAFLQTKKGRVLFTPNGACIGIQVVDKQAVISEKYFRSFGSKLGQERPEVKTRTVVFNAGFSTIQSKKKNVVPRLEEKKPGRVNFLLGSKDNWQTNISTYGKLVYDGVWDGINLEYLPYNENLKIRLILNPGSDPQQIALETGGESISIQEDGSLVISLGEAELVVSSPSAYQNINGSIVQVDVEYQLGKHNEIGFKLGSFSPENELVIEPAISWSTYLGGPGGGYTDYGKAISIDNAGNAFITGSTPAADFPITAGSYDESWNGGADAFVSKLSSDGSELIYSTYLGGTDSEGGAGIVVDSDGFAYIVGDTSSNDYPTTSGAFSQSHEGIGGDLFLSKLSIDGSELIYSTYLGGTNNDEAKGIAVDPTGNTYVTGYTFSTDFPTTSGAFDRSFNGYSDGFVIKLSSDGGVLIFSTFLGGSGFESGYGISLDSVSNVYITGDTESSDFPVTSGVLDGSPNGHYDVFVSKLSSDGRTLIFSTYLGGSGGDDGYGITVDSVGNVFVTGVTSSSDFPTTSFVFDEIFNGSADLFVSKLNSNGTDLIYSTFIGGSKRDYGYGIALDSSGNAYVLGDTESNDYPTTSGAFDETKNGGQYDLIVSKLSADGGGIIYSTYLGGSSNDMGEGIGVDSEGHAIITGHTESNDFPTTSGAFDPSYNVGGDAFVSKLSLDGSSLRYSTFLGSTSGEGAVGIAVDLNGRTYIIGNAYSYSFPTTSGAYDETWNGNQDIFVCKISSDGSSLSYSTFLGGAGIEYANGIAVDSDGNAHLTGSTRSYDYPTTSGCYDRYLNGASDVFVSKLNGDGSDLFYSTFLGGSKNSDYGYAIALDSSGNAFVTGYTYSSDFPTTSNAFDKYKNYGTDAFVSKISNSGGELIFSTFLGGSGDDAGNGIAVDSSGNAYVTGHTTSINYPTTSGAYDETINGYGSSFVTKLNSDGTALSYSTFLGGGNNTNGQGIALDTAGRAFVTGYTNSSDFPTTSGAYDQTYNGGDDLFISMISDDGSKLGFSSFLGGESIDHGLGIAVDFAGNAYVTGFTHSSDYPITSGAFDETFNNNQYSADGFVSKLNCTGSTLAYSSFLGGDELDYGYGIAFSPENSVYVTGVTHSTNFPTTYGAYEEHPGGHGDAFVSKFSFPEQTFSTLVTPTSVAQGLKPIILTVYEEGGACDLSYDWLNVMTGEYYVGNPLILPIVHQTTKLELVVTDQTMATSTNEVWILCHASEILDLNEDGCNSTEDLNFLLQHWLKPYSNDPNGDGIIDIRDLMYINTDETGLCP